MKRYFEKLKNAPIYLKVAVVLVTALVTLAITVVLCHRYVYFPYVERTYYLEYPWVSGGTVVTYSKTSDSVVALRVSPKTGTFHLLIDPPISRWWSNIYIVKKGEMKGYYYSPQWSGLLSQKQLKVNRVRVTVVIDEGVISIGSYAFRVEGLDYFYTYNWGLLPPVLDSLAIANSVEYIGQSAFDGYSRLSSLTIPDGVKLIDQYAFYRCHIQSPITIPRSMEYIGYRAIDGAVHINVAADNPKYSSIDGVLFNKDKTELIQYPLNKEDTAYIIPDGVIKIGNSAFEDNKKLRAITIPGSVDSISTCAFSFGYFNKLTVLSSVPPAVGHLAFNRMENYPCLYVPKGSKAAYSRSTEWKEFKCIDTITVAGEDEIVIR